MKVLLVWNGPATQAERTVLTRREVPLLVELAKQGVHPHVALFGDAAGLRGDLGAAGIEVTWLPPPLGPSAGSLLRLPRAVTGLRTLIARWDPDISEGLEPMPAIALGLAARGRHAPVLYRRQHAHGTLRLILASRLAAFLADGTVVSCEAMKESAAADDRTPRERIMVATSGVVNPRAVSSQEAVEARRALGIAADARIVSVISRLRWEKGVDVLIASLGLVRSSTPIHVVVAGTGPEEEALRSLAARSPIPVHFLGHRDDVELWYAVSDVVVIPSRRESFGRTTVEAMAAGRPVIASRVGGLVEGVVDGETGIHVPPADTSALAGALTRLLADDDLRSRCGKAARARFETSFTMAHMASARRQAWERALRR
jgi:glycosyltransferase involved in cell wall biosynthesis